MELAEKIKLLRQSKGLTQIKFAELLKIGYSSVQNYEQGGREPYQILPKLCQQFPQYALWLMTDSVDVEEINNKTIIESSNEK